jgi:hypothetical protein
MPVKMNYAAVDSAVKELKRVVPLLPADIEIIQSTFSKLGNSDLWAGDSAGVASAELLKTNNVLNEFYNAAKGAMNFLDQKYIAYQELEALAKRGVTAAAKE